MVFTYWLKDYKACDVSTLYHPTKNACEQNLTSNLHAIQLTPLYLWAYMYYVFLNWR